MFTINKEEIPTPFEGQILNDKDARITLSKELIGADCKFVEIKVIAVTQEKLPSEVAYKRYEIREGLNPKPIQQEEDRIIAPSGLQNVTSSGNPDEMHKSVLDQFKGGGTDSVSSSPGDLEASMDFFGTLN